MIQEQFVILNFLLIFAIPLLVKSGALICLLIYGYCCRDEKQMLIKVSQKGPKVNDLIKKINCVWMIVATMNWLILLIWWLVQSGF